MKKASSFSRLHQWLKHIPIEDPVDRQMGALLQVILIGFIVILILTIVITLLPPPSTSPLRVAVVRLLFGSLIFGIPVLLLRRGYFHGSVFIIVSSLLALMTYAVFSTTLREIAETHTFFMHAILRAGLLMGQKTLIAVFAVSTMMVH